MSPQPTRPITQMKRSEPLQFSRRPLNPWVLPQASAWPPTWQRVSLRETDTFVLLDSSRRVTIDRPY